jgi:hypothetical protein
MVTVAPGTLDPELSVTAPTMLPYSTCAAPFAGIRAMAATRARIAGTSLF